MNFVQISRSVRLRLSIVQAKSFDSLKSKRSWHGFEPIPQAGALSRSQSLADRALPPRRIGRARGSNRAGSIAEIRGSFLPST